MSRLPAKLKQGCRRTPSGLGALLAPQPTGKIVHERGRWVLQRREVDIAGGLAPCALDLQPWEATVPSLRIRSFKLSQRSLSACWIIASPFARISADCAARMPVIARAFPSSLFRAFRWLPDKGVGWYFGAIRTSKRRPKRGGVHINRTPASTHPLRACRCVVGTCRPGAAARRLSK
jgi:hypothetical protein